MYVEMRDKYQAEQRRAAEADSAARIRTARLEVRTGDCSLTHIDALCLFVFASCFSD